MQICWSHRQSTAGAACPNQSQTDKLKDVLICKNPSVKYEVASDEVNMWTAAVKTFLHDLCFQRSELQTEVGRRAEQLVNDMHEPRLPELHNTEREHGFHSTLLCSGVRTMQLLNICIVSGNLIMNSSCLQPRPRSLNSKLQWGVLTA